MSDHSDITPSEEFKAELTRIAAKPEVASPKPIKAKARPKPEFTASTEEPDLSEAPEASPITTFSHRMTTKEGRAASSIKRSPKPYVEYSQAIAEQLLLLMAEGYMLMEICERDDMPSVPTVWRWRMKFPDFDAKLTRAREMLGDQFAWEVMAVARDSTALTAPADRVKMDAFRWLAAKHYPKQYGDKTVTELTGTVVHETKHVIDATQLSEENIDKLEAVLRAAQALPAPEDSRE